MASHIKWYYILSSSIGQTHGLSIHPSYQPLVFCDDGWDGDIHILSFYLILISALEYIRYVMTSIPDVSNVFTLIFSFGVIVEKCCTESYVT